MSSVSNLFKSAGLAWKPDSDSINAPDGVLLRADNMVPDEDGALSVRRGSQELHSFPLGTEDVHSIYTYEGSDGYTYRMMGVDDQVYVNPHPGNHTAHWEVRIAEAASMQVLLQFNYTGGNWEKAYASTGDVGPVPYTATWESTYIPTLVPTLEPVNWNVTFTGTGDIAFGDDSQQAFMARGTTAKKFDGKSFMNWGIPKPSTAPTLTAVQPTNTSLITGDSTEEGGHPNAAPYPFMSYVPYSLGGAGNATRLTTHTFVDDYLGNANGATQCVPGRNYGADVGSLWKNFDSDQDLSGDANDVFEFMVKIADPKHVRYISLDFFTDQSAGLKTYYRYFWNFDVPGATAQVSIAGTKATDSESAYEAKVQTILDPIDPKDKPRVNTPENVKAILANVGSANLETESVPSTSLDSIVADQWVHLSVKRGQFETFNDTASYDWSKIRQFRIEFCNDFGTLGAFSFSDLVMYAAGTGTLTGTYKVITRWIRETDRYYELSPPSAESAEIVLKSQQLRVTVAGSTQNAADDQVTTCWVYVFGGGLDTYYRVETATADPQLTTDLVIDVTKNEVQILTENERLEPYTDEPRDNIIAIAGPWNGRLFTLTSEGYVYPSLQTTPNLFNTYQVIDLSNQGDPLWMVKTSSGIHCGCERDVVFLAGTGDEDADRMVIDLYPHPLNIGTPPFERGCQFVDGNSILYRSTGGLIMLASQGLTHVPDDGIRLLWRGQDRHGVSALNVLTGRFRLTVDGKILYCLAPEGATAAEGTTRVYRLDLANGQWSRLIYPNALLSIFKEPDGTVVAGTNDGHVLELEYGTGDDNSVKPSVEIRTPFVDGGNPLVRKDAFDLQLHCDTNANTATVYVYKDGSVSSVASYAVSTSIPQAYRVQADDIGSFIRAQLKITGTFDEFQLSSMDLTYRVRPQHMTYLDTGYFVADDPSDLVWLQEIEIDANSPSNLYALVYLDDTLYTTETVSVTANVRSVYRVPVPRGAKSRRPRIVVKTTAADGAGEIGFDPYFVRVRTRNSGNQSGNGYRTVWPVGAAP